MSRIGPRFEALAAAGRKGLVTFVTAGDPTPEVTPGLMRALVEAGADVYAAKCAPCHGPLGEGGPNDRLVPQPGQEGGRTIGTWWPYSTTLFDYVRRAMPWDRPGSLSNQEVYAVVAWLLNQNGLVPDNAVMDATSLPQVEMPARSRFVPDDREAYTSVR